MSKVVIAWGKSKCAAIVSAFVMGCSSFDFAEALACLFIFSVILLLHCRLSMTGNVRGFAKFFFVGVEKIPDFILLKF